MRRTVRRITVEQCFAIPPPSRPNDGIPKIFFMSLGNHTYKNESKTRSQLVAHRDYSIIAYCPIKIPLIVCVIFGIFSGI
jgi:hypothetical protein